MSELITLNSDSKSIQVLSQRDKRLAKAIRMVGPITYLPHEDAYSFLIGEIIGQMLANQVSRKIHERLLDICGGTISTSSINDISDEEICSIGLSKNKVSYIRNLTMAVRSGQISFDDMKEMSDSEIIKELTRIKGIGTWTAKMYLIFSLNRPDVLPYEDYAFLQGFGWLYKTDDFTKENVERKCKKWKPYSSIAARYMYRVLDLGYTKNEFHLYK